MSLTRVTITGADDAVDPKALVDLSLEFPFVEWGVLFAPSRTGSPRYPSAAWVERLVIQEDRTSAAWDDDVDIHLAAHFCGRAARETMDGSWSLLDETSLAFRRVQLNGFGTNNLHTVVEMITRRAHHAGCADEFILQARDAEGLAAAVLACNLTGGARARVSALWDVSGGRGLAPDAWPHAPTLADGRSRLSLGFAGGIGPDNVEDVLRAIGDREEPFWIDMETGVRTATGFDLALVRMVLEKAKPFVRSTP